MNDRLPHLLEYLRILTDLKANGTQCNSEINEVMALLKNELLKK